VRYDFGAALMGLCVIALGTAFLLEALDVANFRFEVILPIFVIAAGIAIIASSVVRSRQP